MSSVLTANYSPLQIDIKRISPEFPLGLSLENPSVVLNGKTRIETDCLDVRFNTSSVLKKQKRINIQAGFYGGILTGSMNVNEMEPGFISDMELLLSEVKINDFKYKTDLTDILLNLELAGDYEYFETKDKKEPGKGGFQIRNFSAAMKDSLFNKIGFPLVDFSSVKIEFIQTKNRISLTQCFAQGSIINVKLAGDIDVDSSLETTLLNLRGVILPDSKQLSRFVQIASPGQVGMDSAKEGIRFNISGTLGKPRISL